MELFQFLQSDKGKTDCYPIPGQEEPIEYGETVLFLGDTCQTLGTCDQIWGHLRAV